MWTALIWLLYSTYAAWRPCVEVVDAEAATGALNLQDRREHSELEIRWQSLKLPTFSQFAIFTATVETLRWDKMIRWFFVCTSCVKELKCYVQLCIAKRMVPPCTLQYKNLTQIVVLLLLKCEYVMNSISSGLRLLMLLAWAIWVPYL